jgi:glycosyltransferase involved in cell wall biosynthesis
MHLLVISHTAHYERDGQIVGWGPTVKEVCWLARAFDQVTHLACLHDGPAPDSALPYDTNKVRLELVPPSGGLTVAEKAKVLLWGPRYLRVVRSCLRSADVVQVRCPGSLSLYGLPAASPWSGVKWAKYAGNWAETGRMALSHRFQRWWLRKGLFRGPVTVNGHWPHQPGHVYSFDNPSLTLREVEQARALVQAKRLQPPIRLAFVGRTATAKGLGVALQVVRRLRDGGSGMPGLDLALDVLGDGAERPHFERQCRELEIEALVRFHGWVAHERVCSVLRGAHMILLPSQTEGWPKVLSEAMAYGVVPISSRVSAIPQVLAEVGSGVALAPSDVPGYVQAILKIVDQPGLWEKMVEAGLRAAPRFTYERYLMRLEAMLTQAYGRPCFDRRVMAELGARWNAAVAEASCALDGAV